jgi:hypothetical protein
MRANWAACLRRFAEPGCLRECARLARRSRHSDARNAFGPVALIIDSGQERLDAKVHPNRRARPGVPVRYGLLYLDGKRHVPPLRGARHRGGQDAGRPGFQAAG